VEAAFDPLEVLLVSAIVADDAKTPPAVPINRAFLAESHRTQDQKHANYLDAGVFRYC
jgi:hypothetical protein